MIRKAIFIYNAVSGALAAMLDSAKKLARSSSSACSLCAITHGVFSEKAEWRDLECRLGFPTSYYHRDQIPPPVRGFIQQRNLALPLVLFELEGGGYELALSSWGLGQCVGDPNCLKERLEASLKALT
ncbi:MAG: hypothetical protein ACE1Z1_07550 [Candidatus Acidiferrales bacterium]